MKTTFATMVALTAILTAAVPQRSRGQEASADHSQPAGVAASVPGPSGTATVETSRESTIVFFREGQLNGAALKPSIFLDGKELDRLANGRWLSVHTSAGKHDVQSSAKKQPATVIEIKPGETIYVQMVIVNGTWRGAGRLIQVNDADAQKAIAQLKPLHN